MEITLQGNLKYFKLPEMLTFLNSGEKTGTINLVDQNKDVYIYFVSGSVVYATSNQEKFRLYRILIQKNKIDEMLWRKMEELMLQQGEKLGRIGVEQGILTEEELQDYLKIQVSEIIYDAFNWHQGKFNFIDVMQLPPHAVTIAIDLQNLIMEGARRMDEIGQLTQLLPRKSTVFRVIGDPASSSEKINLSLPEWKILFLIDGKRSLQEVCEESPVDLLNTYRVIYGLYANKFLETVPEEEVILSTIREGKVNTEMASVPEVPTNKMTKLDTGLLISPTANLTINDVLKVTLARLTWKKSDKSSQTFPLVEQEYFIGRQPGNAIHISDPSISNIHARVFKGPEGYVIEDLNSRNGTFLNGIRIDRKLLHDTDSVRVGNSNLVYNIVFEVKCVPDVPAT